MSPTQLSLELLRKTGWYCEVTEKNIRIKAKDEDGEDRTFKQDLFGFVDILCVRQGKTLAVQSTTLSNVSARVNKIRSRPSFEWVKQAGWHVHVHGWHDKTKGGGVKVVDMTNEKTLWNSIVMRGHRSKKTLRRQTELRL